MRSVRMGETSAESSGNDADIRQDVQYPPTKVALPIALSICLACFLVSLDRTIVGVATPDISNYFKSFDDIAWYESAYLLTYAALLLPMGTFYTFYSAKWVFITNVIIFDVGSVVSAAAPSSTAFIIGRAISGIGSAALSTGAQVLIVDLFPLEKRPKYQGLVGATFGIAAVAGPLLGGIFTTKTTWRWCFWINLPIGGFALLVLLLLLPDTPPPQRYKSVKLSKRLWQFDPVGVALLTPGLILLLLGLQWGGGAYSWSSPRVLATMIISIVLIFAFGVFQIISGDSGMVPMRIIRMRSIAAASIVSLGFGSALIIVTFYLPIWYQAIKGLSAVGAGVRMLAYFLSTVALVIGSGLLVSKTGYYTPWTILGTAISIAGCGALSTLSPETSNGTAIGFQILAGIGLGLTLTQPINTVQTVLSRNDIAVGLTIVNSMNFAGGTIFVSVGQSILVNTLQEAQRNIPGLDVGAILSHGASSLAQNVQPSQVPVLLAAYSRGVDNIMYLAMGTSCLAFIASWFIEWRSVKGSATFGGAQKDGPVSDKTAA